MSNLGLERFLGEKGLTLERTAVGDRSVMARMREGGFNLGGEASGHIIMSDFSTTGDGLIAALQVLVELVRSSKPMSALARQFAPAPQMLENVRFGGGRPLEADAVKAAIVKAEARLERLRPPAGAGVRHRTPDPHHGGGRRRAHGQRGRPRRRRGRARGGHRPDEAPGCDTGATHYIIDTFRT